MHGSVSQLIDPSGNTTASYGYKPYGQSDSQLSQGDTDKTTPLNPFRYSAKRMDSGSGTLDMGVRRFGPDISHFLTPDFFYGSLANLSLSTDPLTDNRYGMAGGNPISFKEWDGHMAIADGSGVAATDPAPNRGPAERCGGCEDTKAVQDAVIVAGTVRDVQEQTATLQRNAKAGADWQKEVRNQLEQMYDPNKYEIVENKAIRNQQGETVKINGRYVRPDFQIIDIASDRIAAIYEAKTGAITYLSGPGQQVITRYQQYAAKYAS